MSLDAREAMLGRIRAALGGKAASTDAILAGWQTIARDYDVDPRLSLAEKLDLLEDRLRDYDADVTRVADENVASAIGEVLAARGGAPMLIPAGFPQQWIPVGTPLTEDSGLSSQQLDAFQGVLTAATLAIADTGSLVLQNVPGQGRRAATLVPDFHLCVVRADDIVENVPEAFARLGATSTLPTTFISGPSATADIEMTRIKGVHGPRFLHVLLATTAT